MFPAIFRTPPTTATTPSPWAPAATRRKSPTASSRRWEVSAARSRRSTSCATSRTTIKMRSEEHTSELQSLRHLVCRLLLEKKNGELALIPQVLDRFALADGAATPVLE